MLNRLALLLPALLLVLAAPRAAGAEEEVFVLDNGTTFRGEVVQADANDIEVQLAGFGRNASVTLARARIVTRFIPVSSEVRTREARLGDADWVADARDADAEPALPVPEAEPDVPTLPDEEPSPKDEGFFHRLARVTALAMPPSVEGRTALAVLLFVALLVLVLLGCRLAEIDNLGLGRSAVVAATLGAILVADIAFHDFLLRADRATWVLPVEAALWLAIAVPVLRCGLARSILLFAFVMFSLAVIGFSAGAILVTY